MMPASLPSQCLQSIRWETVIVLMHCARCQEVGGSGNYEKMGVQRGPLIWSLEIREGFLEESRTELRLMNH